MKKLFTLFLALTLMFSLAQTALAAPEAQGGTLNMGTITEPATMQPLQLRLPVEMEIAGLSYETLFRMDTYGNPQPWLLESYEEDAEAKTFTFKVRDGVTFTDGTALDAEALAWNLNYYKENGILTSSFFSYFDSAEAVDDTTVVAHLTSFDSTWIAGLTRSCWVFSPTAYEENGAEWFEENSAGTGPFALSSWEHGVKMGFEKNASYWGGEPKLDEVVYNFFADSLSVQAAMTAGDIDATITSDLEMANSLVSAGFNANMPEAPVMCCILCFYTKDTTADGEANPLADARVRQAVSHAIDPDIIISTLTFGYGSPSSQWCVKESPFYNPDVDGQPYDVDEAKRLLEEAGYADGFTTTIKFNAANVLYSNVAQIIAEQLGKVGITVELQPCETAAFVGYIGDWEEGMFLHSQGVYNGFASQTAANFRQNSGAGALGYAAWDISDELDEAVNAAMLTDVESSYEIWQNVQQLIIEDSTLYKTVMTYPELGITSGKVQDLDLNGALPYLATWWNASISE